LVYGLSLLLMQTYLSSWANMVPYVLLILILLIKPSGLLGKGARNA
ncbi:MAG: branched-chain amino acid ABC transporter permease, partial [Bacilli bacterium]